MVIKRSSPDQDWEYAYLLDIFFSDDKNVQQEYG